MSGTSDVALALVSADLDERRSALEALAASPELLDASLALTVADCLRLPRKDLQRRAVDVLRLGGGAAHEAVLDVLRAACAGGDPTHQWGAVYALGHLGRFESVMIPPLIDALANPDGDQRWAAAQLLVANGAAHGAASVPALLEALTRPEPLLRKMVLYVVRDLRLDSREVVDALTGALRDPDVGVRLAGLSGLVRLEPLPRGAGELVLAMAAEDEEPGVRRAAVSALGRVGLSAAAVAPVLDAAAASDDAGLRRAAVAARAQFVED